MRPPDRLYTEPLALLNDLYQLTMAYGHWREGRVDDEAIFHLSFRSAPFGGAFAVACGIEAALDHIESFRFTADDLEYLGGLRDAEGGRLFEAAFLDFLRDLRPRVDVDGVPEGEVVFPHEPLLRVRGPIIDAQLLETPLLTSTGFASLVATKAARVCHAARGAPVLEFGARRAQGIDGAVTASRAAWIGGCAGTSNLLAGKLHGVPVLGTHAHSWVLSFDSELEAFDAYARALPAGCVLLVDTYGSRQGLRHAVEVGRRLARCGHRLAGVRIDSGDLGALSRAARRALDEAGLTDTAVVASGDLDEEAIDALLGSGAPIGVWGVGTRLATAWGQPALGVVYKLASTRTPGGAWRDRAKRSDEIAKATLPGPLSALRWHRDGRLWLDAIHRSGSPPRPGDPLHAQEGETLDAAGRDATRQGRPIATPADAGRELLVPLLRCGRRAREREETSTVRARALAALATLPAELRALRPRAAAPTAWTAELREAREELVAPIDGKDDT